MKFKFIHIVMPIVIGGLIYILFREKQLLMFEWFEFLNLGGIVNMLRVHLYGYKVFLPKTVLFSLPDAMWVYSFTMFLSLYFRNWFIILIPCVGSVLVEVGQLWFVPGTYDILDNIYMVSFSILAFYFINKERIKNEKKV